MQGNERECVYVCVLLGSGRERESKGQCFRAEGEKQRQSRITHHAAVRVTFLGALFKYLFSNKFTLCSQTLCYIIWPSHALLLYIKTHTHTLKHTHGLCITLAFVVCEQSDKTAGDFYEKGRFANWIFLQLKNDQSKVRRSFWALKMLYVIFMRQNIIWDMLIWTEAKCAVIKS